MVQQIYTQSALEKFSIIELRAVCRRLSIPARRSKTDCISDILAAQPQLVAQAELEAHVEEQAQEIAPQTCASCPHFASHNDGTDKGWCSIFDSFARECHPITQDCINNFEVDTKEPEQVDDYLFHTDPKQEEANLPQTGNITMVAGYILQCISIGGRHAVVWDVFEGSRVVDRIYMSWNITWERCLSHRKFGSVQEAITDLAQTQAFLNRGSGRRTEVVPCG